MQHLLKDSDLSKAQIEALLALGKAVKADPKKYSQALAGKSVVTLFEKPSLRTRVTFDIGIAKLGGHSVYLDQQNGADVFRVVFDKQATDWIIGFNEDDLIAALLFRPAQD